ncbi:helix-turn-helix domain-containing protein [Vibrio splendidus]|uniref:helix-turn-helix domain-containing protein n=1 Tax=Vibrio splendidus TaxID=29497 RepID=UPI00148DEE38|nr:helix-turn-helix domain-containing protein [Vibrio splendidus]NOJ06957.1 helix-turn-helix transcriptional regulator [Vibrio splendidus]
MLELPLIAKSVVSHFQQCVREDKSLAPYHAAIEALAVQVSVPFSMDTSAAQYVSFNVFTHFLEGLRKVLPSEVFVFVLLGSAERAVFELDFYNLSAHAFLSLFPFEQWSVESSSQSLKLSFQVSNSSLNGIEAELFLIVYSHAYFKAQQADIDKPIRYDLVSVSASALSELRIQTETPQYLGQTETCISYNPLDRDCSIKALAMTTTSTFKVTQALLPYIGRVDVDLVMFGQINRMGKRRIQRALSEEGTTFRSIKEALSFEFAKRVMTEQDYSISDIALHLGYADASQFIRSFKRVNGITPYQWKKGHVK